MVFRQWQTYLRVHRTFFGYPDMKNWLEKRTLSTHTITWRIGGSFRDIQDVLEKKTDQCDFCSIVLDERTDISDTVQYPVFTRCVINNFEVIEELLDVSSEGNNKTKYYWESSQSFWKIQIRSQCGVTINGTAAVTEIIKRFLQNFYWMNWDELRMSWNNWHCS